VGFAIAAVIGIGAGVATSYLQDVLPDSSNSLANSGAVWVVIAFLVAVVIGPTYRRAVLAGLLVLLAEVVGYYWVAAPLREISTSSSERLLWSVAAVVIGPIVGWCAGAVRLGDARRRTAGGCAIGGIVTGEAVHLIVRVGNHETAGWVMLVVGIAWVLEMLVWVPTPWLSKAGATDRLIGLVVAGVFVLLTYVAYGQAVQRVVDHVTSSAAVELPAAPLAPHR
jgi:hypothetical protein